MNAISTARPPRKIVRATPVALQPCSRRSGGTDCVVITVSPGVAEPRTHATSVCVPCRRRSPRGRLRGTTRPAKRRRIAPYLRPTPLYAYGALSDIVNADVRVKHENHLPIGAFKVRGGVNLVAQLSGDERSRGVISASTGNHGQSIAYASRLFGVRAIVCVPEGVNPVKLASMEALGAEIVTHGRDFDEAREHCARLAAEHGYRYVHSGDEPHLIAGVATATLELLEEQPEIDTIVVPVGGGSGAAGACIAG